MVIPRFHPLRLQHPADIIDQQSATRWNQSKRLMKMPRKLLKEIVPQAYAHASRHRHKAHKGPVGEYRTRLCRALQPRHEELFSKPSVPDRLRRWHNVRTCNMGLGLLPVHNNQVDFLETGWAYRIGQRDFEDVAAADAIFAVVNGVPPDEG